MTNTTEPFEAVILAGGQGSRMGGLDKGLVPWQGTPLYQHALSRLAHQSVRPQRVSLSVNRNLADYAASGLPLLGDSRPGHAGPLAGIETALLHSQSDWLLCLPCDMPLLPTELAARLLSAVNGTTLAAYATTAEGPQPVCCLLHRSLCSALSRYLDSGQGRVLGWLNTLPAAAVGFDDSASFANFNTLAAVAADEHKT
ncbi:molybdenum cofactor guanylyltransferase MobA [Chitinimonas viridis]|uniref:Molybdenum cofactor guanylyltransferase n=1 Tax=Chitinimonas viridis TaxID=664880 RepID=A0ABT8AZV8_9NEIS|nr:molybdenum cofactor guanylyltransferase MobA [Chitinimonas viridis]MDN3575528.1 molybdenum cofactor guanylyltransferase MobA [Chitinimonas viridis]